MSAPAAAPTAPDPSTGTFTHRQVLTILSGLMLGMFLAALDQNIVSTSIRTIADDLKGLNLQAWATTAYLITATISTPLYGKLSDLYGRRPFFLAAIGLFVAGSVLCTISTSMYELAAFRALQGLGGGGLMSLALTIIGDVVPPRQRARYQGYFLAMFGTASVIGPVVGGFFAGADSILGLDGWRWVFLVNVPIGMIALVVVARVLRLPHTRREHRLDFPGAASLALALVPLLLVAEQGRAWGWTSVASVVCYALAVVGLVAFLLSERAYGDDALLPLRLFRTPVFGLATGIGVITGIGMFGGIAILPQYLQIVIGATPTQAGLQMIPLVGGMMVGSVVSGQLVSRTGRYKIFPVVGLGLMTAGMLLFHFVLGADTPYSTIAVLMAVFGLGLGNCMQSLTLATQNAVPARDMGVATASSTFFRQMGGTLGVAVFLSVLFSSVQDSIGSALRAASGDPAYAAALADPAVRADPANVPGLDPAAGTAQVVQDSSVLQRMDGRLAHPFLVGFADSMDLVFLCAACVLAVGFVLIWFLEEVPLRAQSGIAARAQEDAGVAPGSLGASPGAGAPSVVLSGRVRGDDRAALAGATVAVTDPDGRVLATRRTDDDGFWGAEVAPGTATVTVHAAGTEPTARRVVVGSVPARVDVTLAAARHAVVGHVLAGARPASRVSVVLLARDGSVLDSAVTGDDGAFRFTDVPPGRHMLAAGGFAPVSREIRATPDAAPVEIVVGGEPSRRSARPGEATTGEIELSAPDRGGASVTP